MGTLLGAWLAANSSAAVTTYRYDTPSRLHQALSRPTSPGYADDSPWRRAYRRVRRRTARHGTIAAVDVLDLAETCRKGRKRSATADVHGERWHRDRRFSRHGIIRAIGDGDSRTEEWLGSLTAKSLG